MIVRCGGGDDGEYRVCFVEALRSVKGGKCTLKSLAQLIARH